MRSCAALCRLEVLKPHSNSVTAIEFSSDGRLMATGSADGTVFLLAAEAVQGELGLIPHFTYEWIVSVHCCLEFEAEHTPADTVHCGQSWLL
jgi:WD40 repeat protein